MICNFNPVGREKYQSTDEKQKSYRLFHRMSSPLAKRRRIEGAEKGETRQTAQEARVEEKRSKQTAHSMSFIVAS